jgi:uncharacterized protein YbaR (Trm112 family)
MTDTCLENSVALVEDMLACPVCKGLGGLTRNADNLVCSECPSSYPLVDGIPILLNHHVSTFGIPSAWGKYKSFRERIRKFLPKIGGTSSVSRRNYTRFAELLVNGSESPVVLVIGGAILGDGMEPMLQDPRIRLVETDVNMGPRTQYVCDTACLPFQRGVFDGVIIQSVLSWVAEPSECVAEICRVLKPGGVVYSETAFLEAVSGGRYDFMHPSQLGHRRLFRSFSTISTGPVGGPALAVAWSLQNLFVALFKSRVMRDAAKFVTGLFLFWLKYLDLVLRYTPGATDTASATWFMGRKVDHAISDHDLILEYRGAVRAGI